ncbi:MAG TPA: type II secretion system F family protein [Gemmatimonadaceae bacterium]
MTGASAGTFAYEALRPDGAIDHGLVDASSVAEAISSLGERGLLPTSVRPVAPRRERRRRIPARDLALGLRVLADLLQAGLPLARALAALEDLAPASWHIAIPPLLAAVREGKSLAAALEEAPIEVPPLIIGIARAGEAGAGLGAAIRRAADHTEQVSETRAAVRGALAYPLVVAVAGCTSIGLMVGIVLPRFAKILADLGETLPWSTRMVLGAADVLHATLIPAALGGVAAIIALRAWHESETGRRSLHAFLLRLPVLGAIRWCSASARALSSLAALLESGVAIRGAMVFAARSTGDAEIERRILDARDAVVGGHALSFALRENNALTTTAMRLVRAGEESGRLVGMLQHAAKLDQDHADRLTRGAVRLIEPMLILAFAGIIGVVSAALLQAVYTVRPS